MKKKQLFGLIILLLTMLLIPNNINAKEEKVVCKYNYKDKELVYTINGKVDTPFTDGTENFYHADNFNESYLKSGQSNNGKFVCPTIMIEESSLFKTIFSKPKNIDECNGTCTTLVANNNENKAVDTTAISGVGIFNEDKYFIPYFRLLNDGTKEWSIDGMNYYSVFSSITVNNSKINIDKKLVDKIFNNNKLNKDVTLYRNVKKENNTYIYLLSTEKENTYDLNDGQETKANAYHAAYGDPDYEQWLDDYNQNQNCEGDNSILGSIHDPNSVAYFLQIIFNWLKLIGPFIVVVMSGIEFTKLIVTGDDDGMKKAKTKLITRLILVALLFFLPDLISAFLELFNITSSGICGIQ